MSTKKLGRVMRPTITTATYHRGKHLSLMQIAVLANRGKIHEIENIQGVFIPLSDPAALVEKVAKEYVGPATWKAMGPTAQYLVCEDIVDMLRALGTPAKLLKERKKKPL